MFCFSGLMGRFIEMLKFWNDIIFEDILKSLVPEKDETGNVFLMVHWSLIV